MHQAQVIYNFNQTHRPQFNPDIFIRDTDKIIYYLEQMLLSCQRKIGIDGYFTLEIDNFQVIDSFQECQEILARYEEAAIQKSAKKKAAVDNRYSNIDLKPTELKLLIVTFKIETYEGTEKFQNILAVPRIIDKFFVSVNGKKRALLFQMVESTYNNATSSKAKSKNNHMMVTLKSIFNAIRVYCNRDIKITTKNEEVPMVTFYADIFKKSVPVCMYLFAKMGYVNTIHFLGLSDTIFLTTYDMNNPNFYTFCPKKTGNMFINCPREALDNNVVAQHVVNTLCLEFTKKVAVYPDILGREAWIFLLGRHFNTTTSYEKGISVLSSLKLIYDNITKETLQLPDEDKADIYTIFRWLLYEYDSLYMKNNLDVRLKRVRCEEYIAALYAPKLSKAIYALSDLGERVTLKQIKKRLLVDPLIIISELSKCSTLAPFHDMVSDVDAYVATKESNQGVSGIAADGTSKSLPESYLYLNESHIGILGLSESSASSIGSSANLTPFTLFDKNGYFTLWNFREPCSYMNKIIANRDLAIKSSGLKQVVDFIPECIMKKDSSCKDLTIQELQISPEMIEKLILMNK